MKCTEPGCTSERVLARGLCNAHYHRKWRRSMTEEQRQQFNAKQLAAVKARLANMTFDEETEWLERKNSSSAASKRKARANGRKW